MKLVTGCEMKEIDKQAVEKYGVPDMLLMDAAAKQVADAVVKFLKAKALFKSGVRVTVFCGGGNNGGDGFGAARWLLAYGVQVKLFFVGADLAKVKGSAAAEMLMYTKAGGRIVKLQSEEEWLAAELAAERSAVLVDAVLGTGFTGELRADARKACRLMNAAAKPVIAVDIPSGVNADDGSACEDAVRADVTVTMALPKTGLCLYPGRELAGRVQVAAIGMPEKLLAEYPGHKYRITAQMVQALLPLRATDAHKGDAGRVLICAGSPGYTGAAALCGRAAVKAGAGLVSLLTPLSSREVLAVKLTEVMVHGLLERMPGVLGSAAVNDVLQRAANSDVLAVGPGLGVSDSTQQAVRDILQKTEIPVIIDADALTALKDNTVMLAKMQAPKVLTPHPGEMARLTGLSVEEINRNRISVAAKYAKEWQAVVLLKGAPTVIGCPDGTIYVNSTGSSALATGGSGDVLTGIIAALAAQGISLQEAAVCGVYLHGLAGSLACGSVGLAAGEIADFLAAARSQTEKDAAEASVNCTGGVIVLK